MKIRREAFSCLNRPRFAILAALRDVELETSEVCRATGLEWHNAFYHLGILAQEGFVKERVRRKRNFSGRAKRSDREIKRFILTRLGLEALDYFPYPGKNKKRLL